MGTNVKLNFINDSNDQNNSEVVFFSKNGITGIDELAVAWTVIKNCGRGWHHPFIFPMDMKVGAMDAWGNEIVSPLIAAGGQLFHVFSSPSGDQLDYFGPSSNPAELALRNDLAQGAITANIFKDGKLFVQKAGISPAQMAVFQFKPTLWVGVVSQVEEGQIMNSAIVSSINTEISLLGIASADIVMTGGGVGSDATDFVFTLENVVYA